MATRSSRRLIRSANCVLVSTQFGDAGDGVEFYMDEPGVLTPENFTRKSIMTRGSFEVQFNDGNDHLDTADVWPTRSHQHPGKFNVVALESNSQYYCVIPVNNQEMLSTTSDLAEGAIVNLPVGTVNFVYGNNYTVNHTVCTANDVFAIETQTAILTATQPIRLVQCRPGNS